MTSSGMSSNVVDCRILSSSLGKEGMAADIEMSQPSSLGACCIYERVESDIYRVGTK